MLELGAGAASLHADLATSLKSAAIDLIFTAGPLMKSLHDALPRRMRGDHARNAEELAQFVIKTMRAGDVIAIKGSHGSQMGVVVDAISSLAISRNQPAQSASNEQ
jgi:UDP-N-acetylmuramoyl-tripeptide--D-alanyl-D-alanine ligase